MDDAGILLLAAQEHGRLLSKKKETIMDAINSAGFFSFPGLLDKQTDKNTGRERPSGGTRPFTKKEEDMLHEVKAAQAMTRAMGFPKHESPRATAAAHSPAERIGDTEKKLQNALCSIDHKRLQVLLDSCRQEINEHGSQLWVRLLTLACGIGDLECLAVILPYLNKEQIEFRGRQGRTPLMEAVLDRDAGVVRALLDAGASPDMADDFGETALSKARHLATLSPAFEDLKELCEGQQRKTV